MYVLFTPALEVLLLINKHIRAKPSALSQNPSQLLARMRRCVRVILSTCAQLTSYSRPRPAPKALNCPSIVVFVNMKTATSWTFRHFSELQLRLNYRKLQKKLAWLGQVSNGTGHELQYCFCHAYQPHSQLIQPMHKVLTSVHGVCALESSS